MLAKPVQNALTIKRAETLPNGIKVVLLDCAGSIEFNNSPKALEYDGELYGRTGWNSDTCTSYYRTDKKVAFSS
jgi:hypothetical protein